MRSSSEMKEELLEYALTAYREGLFAGTSGNLSAYDRESSMMAVTPTSVPYEGMTAGDIVLMRLDGVPVEGGREPSSEWRMHAVLYQHLPGVGAVVHTHSPYATSFAVNHEGVPVALIEMVPFLGGDLRVAPFALPGTAAVGEGALAALEGRNACLLANHGALAVGGTLAQAHIRAVYVEDAAKIYHLAKLNGPVHLVPEEQIRRMKE